MTPSLVQALACGILYLQLAPLAAEAARSKPLPTRTAGQIVGIEVGFAGHYKAGLWTVVRVQLRNLAEPGTVCLTAPDGDGVPCRYFISVSPALPSGNSETTAVGYIRLGRTSGQIVADLHRGGLSATGRPDGPPVATRTFVASAQAGASYFPPALPSENELILVVGPTTAAVDQAAGSSHVTVVRLDSLERLPDQWMGYESVGQIVLVDTSIAPVQSNAASIAALVQWVRLGGSLLLSAGEAVDETSQSEHPLREFLPGKTARSVLLRRAAALETYAGAPYPIALGGATGGIRVPQWAAVDGRIEAAEGNIPLVVRRAVGLGQVVYVAVGLDRPPLSDWPGRPALVARLLGWSSDTEAEEESFEPGALARYGYDDLAGQLRAALDHFAGVRLIPFWAVVLLLLVYLAAIAPGDYLLVRRIAGNTSLTWITFPLIVVLFSVGAYVWAARAKGHRARLNQIDLVDIDVVSKNARGSSWSNLFSPEARRYDITCDPPRETIDAGRFPPIVSWLGLPGRGLGGMSPKADTPSAWPGGYAMAPRLDGIRATPLLAWSTKSFTARWHGTQASCPQATLFESGQDLEGTLTNSLAKPLDDCLLVHGRWAYILGTLKPGDVVRLGPSVTRRELTSLLTGQRLVINEETQKPQEQATPYDPASIDARYVMRAMMFFRAAGGRQYTGLGNAYQDFVDMSSLLKTGRAVLVARPQIESQQELAARWQVVADGRAVATECDRTVIVRYVFPVELSP